MKTWTRPETKAELPEEGPWQQEPDKAVWVDDTTGLDCMIHRGPSGALCGYVGVPPTHALHGYRYDQPIVACCHEKEDVEYPPELQAQLDKLKELRDSKGLDYEICHECPSPDGLFNAHGGLTYSDACQPLGEEGHGICHVPEPGRPHDIWWFGFDCAHSGDYAPKYDKMTKEWDGAAGQRSGLYGSRDTYKDFAYVQAQVESLAQQVAAFTP